MVHVKSAGQLGDREVFFIFVWADVAQSRMSPLSIVKHFDVFKDRLPGRSRVAYVS